MFHSHQNGSTNTHTQVLHVHIIVGEITVLTLLFFIYLSLFIYICLQAMLGIIIILIGCFHSLLHVLLMMLWSISCKPLYWLSSLFSKQFVLKQEKSTSQCKCLRWPGLFFKEIIIVNSILTSLEKTFLCNKVSEWALF